MYGRWENRRDHPGGRAVGAHGRIKADAPDGADHDDTEGFSALQLYLDFINLFLYLLRIFGGSNKE